MAIDMEKMLKESFESAKESLKMEKAVTTALGLRGYSLEAPAKQLVPILSPLRNRLPRTLSKTGEAVHWKSITAFDPAGKSTAIEGTRGNTINWTMADHLAAFKLISLQDSVTFEAVS